MSHGSTALASTVLLIGIVLAGCTGPGPAEPDGDPAATWDASFAFDEPVETADGPAGGLTGWTYRFYEFRGPADPDTFGIQGTLRYTVQGRYNGTEERTVRTNWTERTEDGDRVDHTHESRRRVQILHHQVVASNHSMFPDGPSRGSFELWLPTDRIQPSEVYGGGGTSEMYIMLDWTTREGPSRWEFGLTPDGLEDLQDPSLVDIRRYVEGSPERTDHWWLQPASALFWDPVDESGAVASDHYFGRRPLSDPATPIAESRPVTVQVSGHTFPAYNITQSASTPRNTFTGHLVIAPDLPVPVESTVRHESSDGDVTVRSYTLEGVDLR